LLRVVHVLAVQAEACGPQLHTVSLPESESRISHPVSRSPEARIANPESRIPNPESRIPNRESRIANPGSSDDLARDLEESGGSTVEVGEPGLVESDSYAHGVLEQVR
jgi:hypothetical protein